MLTVSVSVRLWLILSNVDCFSQCEIVANSEPHWLLQSMWHCG